MLCVTSFTLFLIFGGGPAATTIEVAIYQALRFDFNPERAVSLALLQITVTAVILAALSRLPAPRHRRDERSPFPALRRQRPLVRGCDRCLLLLVAGLFLVLPLGQVVVSGLQADLGGLSRKSLSVRQL